jgi:hypothetical protein
VSTDFVGFCVHLGYDKSCDWLEEYLRALSASAMFSPLDDVMMNLFSRVDEQWMNELNE